MAKVKRKRTDRRSRRRRDCDGDSSAVYAARMISIAEDLEEAVSEIIELIESGPSEGPPQPGGWSDSLESSFEDIRELRDTVKEFSPGPALEKTHSAAISGLSQVVRGCDLLDDITLGESPALLNVAVGIMEQGATQFSEELTRVVKNL